MESGARPLHLFFWPLFTEHLLSARQYAAHIFCAGKKASTWCLSCPHGVSSLWGDTDMNQITPLEGIKQQFSFVELVRKVTEGFLEERRFKVRAEGSTRVT